MIFDWISFYFISFFKEILKNVFLYDILTVFFKKKKKKNSGDMKNSKKNRKMLRKRHYLQRQFESHFWPGKN